MKPKWRVFTVGCDPIVTLDKIVDTEAEVREIVLRYHGYSPTLPIYAHPVFEVTGE